MSANTRTNCFYNLSTEERLNYFEHESEAQVNRMFLVFHGYMIGPLAILAIIFSVIFIVTTFRAIRLRRVSRKHYVLLLNRAIGDLLAGLTATISAIVAIFFSDFNRDIAFLFESFFFAAFWSALVSYTSLSVLKLYAVWQPLSYRNTFTFDKCIYIIVTSWIAFVVISGMTMGVTALVRVQWMSEWSGCKAETCLRLMYRSRNTFTCFVYFFTIVVFLITVGLLKKAERNAMFDARRESRSSQGGRMGRTRFPLWKLALNVSTFAILQAPHVVWSLYLLSSNQCHFQIYYAESMGTLAFVRASIMLRIILDPIVSFITDYQVRKLFLDWIGVPRTWFCYSSRIHASSTISTDSESNKRKSTQPSMVE
ncbi:unnamed protein product, partial [Mesorhabditis belari]|uniref:G-protein coupled receptors family 1 profile domain-containing protein n=1 Tax=Mesorhabditis belari TaxID=2138241 RepID=A0AAF3FCJ8_9BILA